MAHFAKRFTMLRNCCTKVEIHEKHLRFYFIPEDDESTLYIYETLK